MSSSGLIYAVIVGAWAAYLVPMWLRRQDELNEERPTERFSTAIRLLSGRAAMERRYAKDLRARSVQEDEPPADPGGFTGSVDVRALAVPTTRHEQRPAHDAQPHGGTHDDAGRRGRRKDAPQQHPADEAPATGEERAGSPSPTRRPPARTPAAAEAAARARRSEVLARRRRTTVLLFVAFTLGAVVAAVGGIAFLWVPGVPAALLSVYIAYLRRQERRRFAYTMDRRRAEAAAQRLRERLPRDRAGTATPSRQAQPRPSGGGEAARPRQAPPATTDGLDDPHDGAAHLDTPEPSALAAGRRALVEQTDHAEWVDDQRRERRRGPGQGESWDPVPVPLPTYVTAPVAPRAGGDVDLGAPDTWSSARSSAAEPPARGTSAQRDGSGAAGTSTAGQAGNSRESGTRRGGEPGGEPSTDSADDDQDGGARPSGSRRSASARSSGTPSSQWGGRKGRDGAPGPRGRGRTPLFDQYADGDPPRAAGQ